MTAHLRPLTDNELEEWLAVQQGDYVADRIRTGEDPDEAKRIADDQYASFFPDGRPAPGQLTFRVMDGDAPVGWIWIGPRTPEQLSAYWVWNVVIGEEHRGKGFGRAAMLLVEEVALAAGATSLGLNVFGHNRIARRLYESLGYETMAIQMRKELDHAG